MITPADYVRFTPKSGHNVRSIMCGESVVRVRLPKDWGNNGQGPAYQAALAVLGNAAERDFRIVEGIDG